MSGMLRYHDEHVREHDLIAESRDDGELVDTLDEYREGGACRPYLHGDHGQDHRSWRRAVIREALMRGLIDADPGDAP